MQRGAKMMNFCIVVGMPFELLHASAREGSTATRWIAAAFFIDRDCVSATRFRNAR
jgi:hypothetical protein